MSPEQVLGRRIDARLDVFAAGVVLFEMLSGRRAFDSDSIMSVLPAIVYDQKPVLTGSATIDAVDRVVHRPMAKRPEDRYQSAAAMAAAIAEVRGVDQDTSGAVVRTLTRLAVFPFRLPLAQKCDCLAERAEKLAHHRDRFRRASFERCAEMSDPQQEARVGNRLLAGCPRSSTTHG